MILLEGGINKDGFIHVIFFAYASFRKRFMKVLLDLLDKEINTTEFKRLKTLLYDTNDNISTYTKISINTLKNYLPHIKNAIFNPYHNGFVEGNNNFIKVLKRIAFGFRSFRGFKARIMICKNLLHIKRADA